MIPMRTVLAVLAACFAAVGAQAAEDDPYASIREPLELCVTCHGETGVSADAAYPSIAGQHLYYLYLQLKDFKAGRRASPEMSTVVEGLEKDQLKLLAQYYSEQTWKDAPAEPATAEQTKIAESAITAGQCVQCHLGGFEGESGVPRLAGQWPGYLAKTMIDFKTRARANAPDKSTLLESFSEAQLTALAAYLGAL
jgi:cytochrome c553